jgi:cytochrome c oxidase subunit 3
MASTVHEPPKVDELRAPSRLNVGGGMGGGWRNLVPGSGNLRAVREYAPPPSSTAVWVFLASITMTFAALTSALIVREGGALDWRHLRLPSILYLNSAVLLVSSVTLEIGRRQVAAFMGGQITKNAARWLNITLALGLVFVAGQFMAWLQLRAQGLYLATNPSSSFFYLFTAAHGLHLLGGLGGLLRVIVKVKHRALRRSTLDATARYWHFMDVLWMYLLVLLWIRL